MSGSAARTSSPQAACPARTRLHVRYTRRRPHGLYDSGMHITPGPALPAQLPLLQAQAMDSLRQRGWQADYMCVRRRQDLQAPLAGDELVVLGAARLGTTRLIDNLEV